MRRRKFAKCAVGILFLCLPICVCSFVSAQSQVRSGGRASDNTGNRTESKAIQKQPYVLTSRFHLQKGTNVGYLVVKVEMPRGSYIYSLTQKAPLRASKIKVGESRQFRLTGAFNPDRPASVIAHDPVFEQRVEKHADSIQFFAPVEIAADADLKSLAAELEFSGQVCNEQGFCIPISAAKTKGRFAGFFERTTKRANSQSQALDGK